MGLFTLSEDQVAIQATARAFAAERIAPHALDWDERMVFPLDAMRDAAALGMGGIYVRDDVGGSGLSRLDAALIFEALAAACPTVSAFVSTHNTCAWMSDRHGTDEQRAARLPALCAIEHVASYCLTEPGAGSDAAALRTAARRDGDHYVLDGTKQFISGAGAAGLYVVMARTGAEGADGVSTIVVEAGTPGLSFGANERKTGWNAQPTRAVIFEGSRVPVSNRLGPEGFDSRIAMAGLDGNVSTSRRARSAARRPRSTVRLATWASDAPSAAAPTSFRRCSFAWPTSRPSSTPHDCFSPQRPPRWIGATPTARASARWRSSSSRIVDPASPTRRCNSWGGTVSCRNMASRRLCATSASTRSWKARTRSCG